MHPPTVLRRALQGLALVLWMGLLAAAQPLRAQGIELASLQAVRADGVLALEFATRVTLPKTVEDALQRGVPVYFVAQADLYRNRWYWRDERVARISRSWRLAYQPLTGNWRLGLGGLNQTHATQAEAVAALSRAANWKLADLSQLDPDSRYYVEFSFRLDTTQLPSPMQIGLGGQADWALSVERTLRIE
jgi:Domain of unknown function (DUF4390)